MLLAIDRDFALNNQVAKQEVVRKKIDRAVTICIEGVGWISVAYTNGEKWGVALSRGFD